MSGLQSCLATLALLGGFGSSVFAQGAVPGGWAAQFGYQTFGEPGDVGGASFGPAMPGGGQVAAFGVVGLPSYGPAASPYGQGFAPFGPDAGRPTYPGTLYGMAAAPQTVNGVDPLIHLIRQSTRTTRRR